MIGTSVTSTNMALFALSLSETAALILVIILAFTGIYRQHRPTSSETAPGFPFTVQYCLTLYPVASGRQPVKNGTRPEGNRRFHRSDRFGRFERFAYGPKRTVFPFFPSSESARSLPAHQRSTSPWEVRLPPFRRQSAIRNLYLPLGGAFRNRKALPAIRNWKLEIGN